MRDLIRSAWSSEPHPWWTIATTILLALAAYVLLVVFGVAGEGYGR